uniref:Fibronectin type-III domain-containing protein n=1 Tax=Macrostomum lignano TaxID=282301 RepID=A0A1I8FND8_9PLAT
LDRFRVPPVPEEWRTCSAFGALGAGLPMQLRGPLPLAPGGRGQRPAAAASRAAATGWAGAAAGSQWRATGGSLVRKRPGLVRSLRLFALNGSVVAKFSPPTQPDPASKRDYECRLRLRPWLDGARIGPVASETVENSTVRLSARARGRETYTAEVSCRPKYFRLPGNSGWSEPAEAKISTPVWPPCPPRLALLLERRNFVWLSAPPAECRHGPIVSYRLRLGGAEPAETQARPLWWLNCRCILRSPVAAGFDWTRPTSGGQSTNLMASATTSAGEGRTMPVLLAEWLSECPDGWAAGQLELQMLWLRNTENDSVRDATAALARWRLPAAVTVEPPLAIATCEPAANRASATPVHLPSPVAFAPVDKRVLDATELAPNNRRYSGASRFRWRAGSRCVCRQRAEPLPDDALSGRLVLPKVQLLRLNDNGGDGGSGLVVEFDAAPRQCGLRGLFAVGFEVADAAGPLANCSRQRQPPTSARFRCPLPASLSHRPPLQLLARL